MIFKFIINDIELDTFPDMRFAFTFQASDIGAVKDIKSAFSKTIKLPKTAKNLKALGYPDLVQSQNVELYDYLECIVQQDGVNVVQKGYVRVLSCTDQIKLNVFSGNYPFFKMLKDKTIKDIDWSDLDHTWSLARVMETSTADKIGSEQYLYPIIEWGTYLQKDDDLNGVDVRYLYPAVWLKHIIDRLISEAGYVKDDSWIACEPYNNLLVTISNRLAIKQDGTYVKACQAGKSANQIHDSVVPTPQYIIMNTSVYDPSSMIVDGTGWGVASLVVVPTVTDEFYTCGYVIVRNRGDNDLDVCLRVRNQTGTIVNDYLIETVGAGVSSEINWSFEGKAPYIDATYFTALVIKFHTPALGYKFTVYANGFQFYAYFENITFFGHKFPIGTNLPAIKQKDLLKELAIMFGAFYVADDIEKKIKIVQYDDIIKNIPNALDWSDKIDLKVEPTLEFQTSKYGQKNWFKYQELTMATDEQKGVLGFADGYFEIDDKNLDPEKTLATSVFKPTIMIKRFGDHNVPHIPTANLLGGSRLAVEEVESQDPCKRILILSPYVAYDHLTHADTPVIYTDGSLNEDNTGEDNPFVYFYLNKEDILPETSDLYIENVTLHWDSFLDRHYLKYIEMLTRYKKLKINLLLTPVDISNLDFSIPIYIERFSSHFFINKISDYKGYGSTKVELIRL